MIVNLTQHPATPEQRAAGVVDLTGPARESLIEALTFDSLPSSEDVAERAERIAMLAVQIVDPGDSDERLGGGEGAMIGGAPYLMAPLVAALKAFGLTPLFAFSVRESAEQTLPDGSVRKVAVFRHAGFVPG